VSTIDLVELIEEIIGSLAAQAAQQRVSFALSGLGRIQGERFLASGVGECPAQCPRILAI
jgi:hypothetical protein